MRDQALVIERVPIVSLSYDPSNARQHPEKKCGFCNSLIPAIGKRHDNAKFCSRKCRKNWHNSPESFKLKILNSIVIDEISGCWNWSKSIGWHGYGKFAMNGKHWRAHRLSYQVFKGVEIKPGNLILHSCDNPRCVNPDHLSEGSHQQNSDDAKSKGRLKILSEMRLGSRNRFSKLNESIVSDIKMRLRDGAKGVDLSAEYSISRAVISEIKTGKLWRHV